MFEDSFYTIVMGIAIVVLILVLTYIGIVMTYYKSKTNYPPVSATCPDYWSVATDGSSCIIPVGKKNAGNASGYSTAPGYVAVGSGGTGSLINFNDPGWKTSGVTPICAKSQWANQNNIVWDGVSNYSAC
jgi:hypothetical protein